MTKSGLFLLIVAGLGCRGRGAKGVSGVEGRTGVVVNRNGRARILYWLIGPFNNV